MCSRFNFTCCRLLLLLCFTLVTCSRENAPANAPIEVQLKSGGQCLVEMGTQLNKYFKGGMSPSEVVAFWDCTSNAIKEFQRLTSGENGGDSYTPQALRRFLYKYFFKGRQLSDKMLDSLMEIKRVFLSGTNGSLTREELSRLQSFITEMKLITLDLQPHVKILFGTPVPATDTQVNQAARAFEQASLRLGQWFDKYQQAYTFAQMQGFLVALDEWLTESGQTKDVLEKLTRSILVLAPAKKILVAGRPDQIEGHNWIVLMQTIGKIMHVYLDFRYAFHENLNAGMIRNLMPEAMSHLAQIFEQAIARRNGSGLPFTEWQELFEKVEHSKLLPATFTAAALRPAFDWVVIRTLNRGVTTTELTTQHVQRLRRHSRIWQNILDRVNGDAFSEIPEWHKFQQALSRTMPLQWDSEGRLEHVLQGVPTWTQENRRRMVWPFVILNWIKEGYVGDVPVMTEDQMLVASGEVVPMLQNFGWMTSTKVTIGKRLVREADLFTYASNGDSLLDLTEATHYLAFVASSFRIGELWLAQADRVCGGRHAICVRNLATQSDARAFESLPQLRLAVIAQPVDQFLKYMKAAEDTVLGKVVSGDMGTKDIMQVMMLFQYVEVFLRIYDADGTEQINLVESLVAYQKYGPTLARLLSRKGLPPDEVLAFYTFMMKYGDTPFTKFGGSIYFLNWKLKRNDWAFEADRFVLMNILNQLSKL